MRTILVVSNSLWNIENFRKNLILKILDSQYKVIIIAPFEKSYKILLSHRNLKIINLNFKSKSYFNLKDFIFVYKLFKIIKYYNPEYVLSFTVKPNLFCSFLSKLINFKCISNITGLGTLFLRGYFVKRIAILLYKYCLKNSYHTFFHNANDKKIFIENKIIFKKNSSIIPGSGIDLNIYKYSKKIYLKNKVIKFLYLGRIMKDKGINELLKAIENIKKDNLNAKFIFAGKIDNKDKKLIKLFDYFIKNKYIQYMDEISNVSDIISECDCLILPSYREGLSRSLLEGSAIGRPLLVSDVPGCNDIVKDGYNGLLFEAKNYKSLQRCLLKFINLSPNLKNEMSINANLNSKLFDEKIVIENYLKLIN